MKVVLPLRLPGLSVPVEGAVQAGPPRRVPRQAVRVEAFHASGLQRGDLERRILGDGAHAGVAYSAWRRNPGGGPSFPSAPCGAFRGAAELPGRGARTGRAAPDKPVSLRHLV